MSPKKADKYADLRTSLEKLPYINPPQVEQWLELQNTIDNTRDYLIRAVPDAQFSIEEAEKILGQRTYTLVFFGGTGVGKSTLINSILGRNLLPTGAVTAVTGTIVYVEQAEADEEESLVLTYWSQDEFASRVRRLCQLSEIDQFDITNSGEREQAKSEIDAIFEANRDQAKTERDEYLEIVLDCIATYEGNEAMFAEGQPAPKVLNLHDPESLMHLREDGFKGNTKKRQIRIVRSATFRVQPKAGVPNLLLDGHLRIVDVPGLGAGMKLHEAITLEEMNREDAMIVLVTDAGRQRVDELKSLSAVNWIKENRLHGLSGGDLDEAAAKVFVAVNGANIRQAFDRINSGLPEAELEVKEVTRHIAPNYWERYSDRGSNRPFFFVMTPPALYTQDPENAPREFASETERIMKMFADQLGNISDDPLDPATTEALLELSEVPLLRQKLIEFIQNSRVRSQLREASTRVRNALQSLRFYYEKQLAARGVHPPFDTSWSSLQERRYENVLNRHHKELPRVFHAALVELSQRTNSNDRFRGMMRPTLNGVQNMVQDAIQREIDSLLENYGTEYWDDRDVTYDNLIWGTSGIEIPIKRILFQVELVMQDSVSKFMPEVAEVMTAELTRTLESHEILSRIQRAEYEQGYTYTLPDNPGEVFNIEAAYKQLIERVNESFRQICQQATMYELVKPERSVHYRLEVGERELNLHDNERILDVALDGVEEVRRDVLAQAQAIVSQNESSANSSVPAPTPAPAADDGFEIKLLDDDVQAIPAEKAGTINFPADDSEMLKSSSAGYDSLETSYAQKLDNISVKTNKVFSQIVEDLFSEDDLLPRLRRLFWLEATKAERDFNNHIIKPMLRQHDRKLYSDELREAMAVDLESVSDVEELMRTWEGLHDLEMSAGL